MQRLWLSLRSYASTLSRSELLLRSRILALRSLLKKYLIRKTEYPLLSIGCRERLAPSRPQVIPPVVYQVWVADLFGRTHSTQLNVFRNLNPHLEFKLFCHSDVNGYMRAAWGDHPIY